MDVVPVRLIAVQDRNKHNAPRYAHSICKVFVLCDIVAGEFRPNSETTESRFFGVDELPVLSDSKNTAEQVRMCFDAYHDEDWAVQFD